MRNLQESRSHATTPAAERSFQPHQRAWPAHSRPELISDGVVAGYIHEISTRHRHPSPEREFGVRT